MNCIVGPGQMRNRYGGGGGGGRYGGGGGGSRYRERPRYRS